MGDGMSKVGRVPSPEILKVTVYGLTILTSSSRSHDFYYFIFV